MVFPDENFGTFSDAIDLQISETMLDTMVHEYHLSGIDLSTTKSLKILLL